MILNDEQIEAVDHEHKQKILRTEVEMLSGLIAEMAAKQEEITANLDKLTVVRDVLESRIEPELDLDLESEPESES